MLPLRYHLKGKILFSSVELAQLVHGPNFVVEVKCTIFWRNRGLRVCLDLYAPDFQKVPRSSCFVQKYLEFMDCGGS